MPIINGHYYIKIFKGIGNKNKEYGLTKDGRIAPIKMNAPQRYVEDRVRETKYNFNIITQYGLSKLDNISQFSQHIFHTIYNNRNPKTNITSLSHKELAYKLSIPLRTLNNHLANLKNIGLIKTASRRIFIDPDFTKVSANHRGYMMRKYLALPIDQYHPITIHLPKYNKIQLRKISRKLIGKEMKKDHVSKRSKRNAWSKMVRKAIRYSNRHYAQYDILNCYLVERTHKLMMNR